MERTRRHQFCTPRPSNACTSLHLHAVTRERPSCNTTTPWGRLHSAYLHTYTIPSRCTCSNFESGSRTGCAGKHHHLLHPKHCDLRIKHDPPAYTKICMTKSYTDDHTFSNSSLIGLGKILDTSSAAFSASGMASSTVLHPNLTITESVSPYTTSALCSYPFCDGQGTRKTLVGSVKTLCHGCHAPRPHLSPTGKRSQLSRTQLLLCRQLQATCNKLRFHIARRLLL